MTYRCPICANTLDGGAKFCPRCGKPVPRPDEIEDGRPEGYVPSRTGIPLLGRMVLGLCLLVPALVVLGWAAHAPWMLLAGAVLLVGLVLFVVVGSVC